MTEERKFNWVGTRPVRPDGLDKVTGHANYGSDMEMPGMLHGRVLRSPHAHARIRSIDLKPALAIEGVLAAVTGQDLPDCDPAPDMSGEYPIFVRDLSENLMARDKALYDGHAVAAVAATTPEIARRAIEAIKVDYEVLPHVIDVMEAIAPGAPLLHEDQIPQGMESDAPSNIATRAELSLGDLDAGFKEADIVIEREFDTAIVHQGYIEPHACVVRSDQDDDLTIWCSTQGGFAVRTLTGKVLKLDTSKIKVIPSEIGGGFGGKTTIYLEPVAALLSRKSGRPVKLVMDRTEVFRATGPAPPSHIRVKIGAKRDGTLTAADASLYYGAGAYKGSAVSAGAITMFSSYEIPNQRVEGFDIVINTPKSAAYRAPGAPMAAFGVEQVLDEIAEELEFDPVDLRLQNAAGDGTKTNYGVTWNQIGVKEVLEAVKAHPHYKAPLGENQGRGVAFGHWMNGGMNSSATIQLSGDGTATVATGNPDIGGSRASMALMAAEELQIPFEHIRPIVADTDAVPFTDMTGGSRVTVTTGAAVIEAARKCVDELRNRAALTWGISVDDVAWEDGRAIPLNGAGSDNEPLSLVEILNSSGGTGGPIAGVGTVAMPVVGPGFGAHICDVEVDPETGYVKVLRYTAVQDVGKAIHPSYVEGQLQGGAVQGIGWALNEEFIYDENGHLENPGFLDYRMPVASDVPMIDTVLVEVPAPTHPYGARGVGETPIVPPLATLANAIHDAVGVRMTSLPMSPPRLLEELLSR